MDIHPISVHFPIALLTLYAGLELLTIHRYFRTIIWKYIRSTFLILGAISALITIQTGEIAAEMNFGGENGNALITMHSFWANASAWIFCIIAGAYLLGLINENSKLNAIYLKLPLILRSILDKAESLIAKSWLRFLFALAGLTAITITGALGGAIVYGPTVDPIVNAIYKLLIK